jgi:hypothetical protein
MTQASTPVRSLHKMGLGINLGGTIFGLIALNPTVKRISDKSERGRVLNESWMRFQTIGTLAMGVTVVMWRLGGLKEAESDLDTTLASLKNLLLGGGSHHERRVGDLRDEDRPACSGGRNAGGVGNRARTRDSRGGGPIAALERLPGHRHGRAGGRRPGVILGA